MRTPIKGHEQAERDQCLKARPLAPSAIKMPRGGLLGSLSRSTRGRSLTPSRLPAGPKCPGRQENEHDDEDREGGDILVLDREIGRPHRLDETDEDAAEHRAGQRADAAENGRGERLHAGEEADEEIDHAVIEQKHQPGDRASAAPMTKVSEMVRSTSMPRSAAIFRSCSQARWAGRAALRETR